MTVTRADVAKLAGVSPSVVSYVLNEGMRPVSAQTREKVLRAIAELGYRPDPIAQALRGRRTHTIGLLVPDHENPFSADVQREVELLAFDDDLVLFVGTTGQGPERETKYLHTFRERRIDGLLMMTTQAPESLHAATAAGMPVVVLDRIPDGTGASTVVAEERNGSRRAVEHLLSIGCRRIGCITGPDALEGQNDRAAGWGEALEAAGIEPDPSLLRRSGFTREEAGAAAADLFGRIDGLFASSDIHAVGALARARAEGVAVPEDVSIVSYDGTELSRYASPPLTTMQQPIRQMAETAMRRLAEAITDPGREPTHDVLLPELVVRESTRA